MVQPHNLTEKETIDEIQVHAEASTFASGLSKDAVYAQALEQAESLFEDQRNWVWYVPSIYSPSHNNQTLRQTNRL